MITYFKDMQNAEGELGKAEIGAMLKSLKELKSKYDEINQADAQNLDADKLNNVIVLIQDLRAKLI